MKVILNRDEGLLYNLWDIRENVSYIEKAGIVDIPEDLFKEYEKVSKKFYNIQFKLEELFRKNDIEEKIEKIIFPEK